jgi:4-amino-4-deoxy-L-arabinose transferase-like glycosyltransferase
MSAAPLTRHLALCATILVLAGVMRGVWLTADPPTITTVGVVWHDEGAWTHNARNQALWGVWRTDEWNPMFIAPVFTALETAAFETFGVGTWQARTVPVASGLIAILALMWGLSAVAGRRAALLGGLLLATSYTFVMWNRAALMESTMTMFIVVGWAAYARASARPLWGVVTGLAVVLAFFTKAAAAFLAGAIVLELAIAWWLARKRDQGLIAPLPHCPIASFPHCPIVMGLLVTSLLALAFFVIPYWTEFQFYNWAMTVERKPEYTVRALMDRATWLPLTHGVFTRMWLVVLAGAAAAVSIVARWRVAHPAERLAVLWLFVGLVELVVHDSGNERRYVMFVPALVALASMAFGAAEATPYVGPVLRAAEATPHVRPLRPGGDLVTRVMVALAVAVLAYLVVGSGLRLVWLDDVLAGNYRLIVRVSGALAAGLALIAWWRWQAWAGFLAAVRVPLWAGVAMVVITCGTDLTLYGQWAAGRTQLNYEASRALADLLPPETVVHGKLANGLALENRIVPIFVGRGFGNYADRLERDDARYILTYTTANGRPDLGYEGRVILDVLRHYPNQRIIAEFAVDETPGPDRAALIAKFPDGPEPRARYQ